MTPARTHGKTGNYELDERFKNVGRIRRSLGTDDIDEFYNRRALLRKLEKTERWEILRAFRDRALTIEQLIEADARGELASTLADTMLNMNLWESLDAAADSIRKKRVTVERYRTSINALEVKAAKYLPATARVADLLLVPWHDVADEWGGSGADWMHTRRMLSKTVGIIVGDKFHPFVRKLRQAIPTKKVKKRRPRITLPDFLEIISNAPAHAQRSYWCLLITGLRDRSEYLQLLPEHLDHSSCTIEVPGTKTDESDAPLKVSPRLWPLVVAAVPSRLQYGWLYKYWQRACIAAGKARYVPSGRFKSGKVYVGLTLHDLRHAHGQLALDSGVAESKVQSSYRHENPGQTRDYVSYNASLEVSEALADLIVPIVKPRLTPKPKRRRRAS
ncbi:MAG: hypothetical protein M3O61_03390 [Gemmatimonadota bacterium]|nr:hypothetical protein [Gemmatimonadota bacterium]